MGRFEGSERRRETRGSAGTDEEKADDSLICGILVRSRGIEGAGCCGKLLGEGGSGAASKESGETSLVEREEGAIGEEEAEEGAETVTDGAGGGAAVPNFWYAQVGQKKTCSAKTKPGTMLVWHLWQRKHSLWNLRPYAAHTFPLTRFQHFPHSPPLESTILGFSISIPSGTANIKTQGTNDQKQTQQKEKGEKRTHKKEG